jgi:hypothetical protein
MKIDKNTKIGDLIPEGWKIDESGDLNLWKNNKQTLMIPLIKEEIKDFEWYVNDYIKTTKILIFSLAYVNLKKQVWEEVPFEIRWGLLNHICKSEYGNLKDFLWVKLHGECIAGMKELCPSEFLESIFKN